MMIIDYINKGYRLGIPISKENRWRNSQLTKKLEIKILESFLFIFLTTKIPTKITIPSDAMVP